MQTMEDMLAFILNNLFVLMFHFGFLFTIWTLYIKGSLRKTIPILVPINFSLVFLISLALNLKL